MKNNRKIEEPEINDETIEKKTDKVERQKEVKKSSIEAVLEGDIVVKEGFVKLFPFLMYVVFLLMLCIANTYIAEDVNREIAKLNKMEESLHVEYVYYKSEITKSTTQSNLVKKLAKKGIKESVVPLRKIVAEEEGGER